MDTTLVSPLLAQATLGNGGGTSPGQHWPMHGEQRNGLTRNSHGSGGRWSGEAATFIRSLAQARSRGVPAPLRQATAQAYIARWSGLLAHAAQTAFARSLLFEDPGSTDALDGDAPLLSDLLDWTSTPPLASRLPP